MYEAVMLRKERSLSKGFYIRKFNTFESLVKYLASPVNFKRCYRLRGLTRKERGIFYRKYFAIITKN